MKSADRRILKSTVLCLLYSLCGILAAEDALPLYLDKDASDEAVYFVQTAMENDEGSFDSRLRICAARQIAIRREVFARYIVTGGEKDSPEAASALLDYDQDFLEAIAAGLECVKTRRFSGHYQGLFRDKDEEKEEYPIISLSLGQKTGKDGNPSWVSSPPRGSRFYAMVGAVRIQDLDGSLAGGFFAADERAIASLASCVAKPIVSGSTRMYEATICGAYIARRWFNQKNQTFYSLAILPKKTK